jgi:Holliday junction resolvase
LYHKNSQGDLPILFTSIGRWWGTDPVERKQVEIDLIAQDGNDYIACECKWRNEVLDLSVLNELRRRTDVFSKRRGQTWYYLFSKSGFTKAVLNEAADNENIVLVDLKELMNW